MDLLDESVACDSEFLDGFSTKKWWDLSIALSMAMRANVEFPDWEELPLDDSHGDLSLMVYDTGSEQDYPMTIRDLLICALDAFDNAECVQSWLHLVDSVKVTERIRVSIDGTPFASWSDFLAGDYPYRRGAPGPWTVARWLGTRLVPSLPNHFVVEINFPNGSTLPGQRRMATQRHVWIDQPTKPWRGSTDPARLFEVMRDARWIGIVRSVTDDGYPPHALTVWAYC